jgi:hypothetical protein
VASIAPVPLLVNEHRELTVSNLVKSLYSSQGTIAGWGMMIDSLIHPLNCTTFCAQSAKAGSGIA